MPGSFEICFEHFARPRRSCKPTTNGFQDWVEAGALEAACKDGASHDSPVFWQQLSKFLDDGAQRRRDQGLAENKALEKSEWGMRREINSRLEELQLFMSHFQLRDHMKNQLFRDLKSPQDGWVYVWSDWKDHRERSPFIPMD